MLTQTAESHVKSAPPLSDEELEAYLDKLRNAQSPIPEMTWEQYREYQSWRIMLQVLTMDFVGYQNATGGEKFALRTRVQEFIARINIRATRFPPQSLPQDLIQPVDLDFLFPNDSTENWLVKLVRHLKREFPEISITNSENTDGTVDRAQGQVLDTAG